MNASNCAWMRCYKPIEGWKAKKTEIKLGKLQSYLIKKCPNYINIKKIKEPSPKIKTSICINCGKQIIGSKKYCDTSCRNEYIKKQDKKMHPEQYCSICGYRLRSGEGVQTELKDLNGNRKTAHKKCWNKKKKVSA